MSRLLSKFIKTLADKVLRSCVPFSVTMRILFLIIVFFFIPPLIVGCCFCYKGELIIINYIIKHKYLPAPRTQAYTRAEGKRVVVSAAVAVVSKLNTLLALLPLINKTSNCIREAAVSQPESHFPSMHRGRRALALKPQTHKYSHTRAGFPPLGIFLLVVSLHIFPLRPTFALKIFLFIPPPKKKSLVIFPECAEPERTASTCSGVCICTQTQSWDLEKGKVCMSSFNAWINASLLIHVQGAKDKYTCGGCCTS